MLVALVTLASSLSACGGSGSPREFAERFIAAEHKAWSTGDVADLKAIESDDIVFHLPGAELKGWQAHEKFIVDGRQTASDLKQDWTYLSGDGEHIVLGYRSSATLKGDGQTPARLASNDYLFVLRLENQKVAEIWANGSEALKPVEPLASQP